MQLENVVNNVRLCVHRDGCPHGSPGDDGHEQSASLETETLESRGGRGRGRRGWRLTDIHEIPGELVFNALR